jgi:hypothetical protein
MTLRDQDWTEEQAQGLLDNLNLAGGTPKWKLERLKRLRDCCSAHGLDAATIDGQLVFVAYELCSGFQAVGLALKRAKTVDEAREVVEPYVRRLSAVHQRQAARGKATKVFSAILRVLKQRPIALSLRTRRARQRPHSRKVIMLLRWGAYAAGEVVTASTRTATQPKNSPAMRCSHSQPG